MFAMFTHKKAKFEQKRDNNKDVYNNIIKSLWLKNQVNKPQYIDISKFIGSFNDEYTHVVIGMDIAHRKKYEKSSSMQSIVTIC